jgi:hypothetical protein
MKRWQFIVWTVVVCSSAALAQETASTPPVASSPSVDDQIKAEDLRTKQLANDETERANREKKRKEILDALPTSTTTGAVTVKDGAGQAEANALSAAAAFQLADQIAGEVSEAASTVGEPEDVADDEPKCDKLPRIDDPSAKPAGPAPVLLVSGTESLSFGHWDQFRFRACKIADDYSSAIEDGKKKEQKLRAVIREPGGTALAGAATALSAAVKLAQLVTPDWEVASLTTTVSNRALLLKVARAYQDLPADKKKGGPIYWQGAVSRLGASSRVFDALDTLRHSNEEAEHVAEGLADLITQGEARLKKPKPPAGLKEAVAAAKEAKAPLDAVIASHAALLKDLYGGDAASVLPMGSVVSEAAAARLLGRRGIVVSVNVDNAGGTSLTRKVIWNAFEPASPPLFISGTVGVSYAAVRASDQRMLTEGAFLCTTGPVRLRKVPAVVNQGGSLSCKVAP